jgi:hypothetical protein
MSDRVFASTNFLENQSSSNQEGIPPKFKDLGQDARSDTNLSAKYKSKGKPKIV